LAFFGRLFGGNLGAARIVRQARTAEARGDLVQAASLFAQAGRLDEASRIMLLRGDAELDPAARLRHYVQALATAPERTEAHADARRKHAALLLTVAAGEPATGVLRQDLLAAARGLEAIGEPEQAAEAYARGGDVDGEARALARAGDVDRLDALLLGQQGRDRELLARREAHGEVAALAATGRRREAAAMARASGDEAVRERGRGVEARKVTGDVVDVSVRGLAMKLVLGAEVIVGRVGAVAVASAAVGRQHVVIARRGDDVIVRDLGSRNGTLFRGLSLTGEAIVGDGIEVRLGKEVPLVVSPAPELPAAVALQIGGARYLAPLGPARLGVGAWRIDRGPDGWVELATDDDPIAFAGVMLLAPRVTLLRGDAFARTREGEPVLRIDD
jgi:hypothetical protein